MPVSSGGKAVTMPCYVIATTHFRDKSDFRDFKQKLAQLMNDADSRVVRVDDDEPGQGDVPDQSITLEFPDAQRAQGFMCSDQYKALAQTAL
ncbi:MAG: DUF1330 domain-containing protein [Pseudooceanicola sp.]